MQVNSSNRVQQVEGDEKSMKEKNMGMGNGDGGGGVGV